MRAKIFYFTLQDEQMKEEKLDWFERTRFEQIPFDHIAPDQKANWINLTDNDFDSFLPLIDKEVKAGKSQEAVFQLFSRGLGSYRDEWVYDFSKGALIEKVQYFVEAYQERLKNGSRRELDIKWDADLEKSFERRISKEYQAECVTPSSWRPFTKKYFYFDSHFNGRTYQLPTIFPNNEAKNLAIFCTDVGTQSPFMVTATNCIPDLHLVGTAAQCLPLYRYDKNGNRIDNITDWGLTQFQTHYNDPSITKEAIFHYTYAVLHHPAYRTKYELNLKREFPHLPFYANFHQWATWGKALMDLHLNYETIEPYGLRRVDITTTRRKGGSSQDMDNQPTLFEQDPPLQNPSDTAKLIKRATPKPKLKADKTESKIILDTETTLEGVPAAAWDYKLGNRSALEWILDQYKEKTPKDPTIAKLFNTYKFADYKEHVIDLL
jgi:predicted helicase